MNLTEKVKEMRKSIEDLGYTKEVKIPLERKVSISNLLDIGREYILKIDKNLISDLSDYEKEGLACILTLMICTPTSLTEHYKEACDKLEEHFPNKQLQESIYEFVEKERLSIFTEEAKKIYSETKKSYIKPIICNRGLMPDDFEYNLS